MSKYNTEFKLKVVKEYLEGNISYRESAKKYSIPDKHTVRTWVNAYESQGCDGLKVKRKNNKYTFVECPNCHEMKLPHRICPECGYYDGKEVIKIEEAN